MELVFFSPFFYIIKQEFSSFADVLKEDVKLELLNDLMELTGKCFHPEQSPGF